MAPLRRKACFRHKPDDASCYSPVQSTPIPTDPEDPSIIAGKTIEMLEQAPICEKPLLPIKKRAPATSDASSDHGSADDGSFAKKRRVESGSDGTSGAYGTPIQTHQYDTVTVCAMAASPKPTSSAAITAISRRLQEKKLMHDAIRSVEQAETSAAGAARAKKKTNRSRNTNREKKPSRGAAVTYDCTRPLLLSQELRARLAALAVGDDAALQFVCMKTLGKSDVDKNQNRLLFSCKRMPLHSHPITALFATGTEDDRETYFVFDGRAMGFEVKLKYLTSNEAYRLIGEWGAFVRDNDLLAAMKNGRRVEVELWAFRSRHLPAGQPELEDENEQKVVEGLEDHPKGALGLLFLPYIVDGDRAEEERERAPPPVHEAKRKQARAAKEVMVPQKRKQASATAVHETRKQAPPAKFVPEEKKLEDDVRPSMAKAVAREMTFQDMVMMVGRKTAGACKGLLTLANVGVL
jgi:hypothetical protein